MRTIACAHYLKPVTVKKNLSEKENCFRNITSQISHKMKDFSIIFLFQNSLLPPNKQTKCAVFANFCRILGGYWDVWTHTVVKLGYIICYPGCERFSKRRAVKRRWAKREAVKREKIEKTWENLWLPATVDWSYRANRFDPASWLEEPYRCVVIGCSFIDRSRDVDWQLS